MDRENEASEEARLNSNLLRKIKRFSSKHKVGTALVVGFTLIVVGFAIFCAVSSPDKIGWTGFKRDTETSRSEKTVVNGKETTITTKYVSGKTLWDWMSLILAPVTLTGLGFWFQFNQEKERVSREESDKRLAEINQQKGKERAEDNQREQALETYLDRISDILLTQQLLSLNTNDRKDKARLDTALDVIRARTLAILQRLNIDEDHADGGRKRSVLLFLYDAELIGKAPEHPEKLESNKADKLTTIQTHENLLRLDEADFSQVNLSNTKIPYANLKLANFSDATLRHTDLKSANLVGTRFIRANLSGTNLEGADLRHAKFCHAEFSTDVSVGSIPGSNNVIITGTTHLDPNIFSTSLGAEFNGASLGGAKIIVNATSLRDTDLSYADFSGANLLGADFSRAKLVCTKLSNAQNLTKEQLSDAKLCHTQLPPDIDIDRDRNCEELGI